MNIFEESRVFAHFTEISKIPRESSDEKAVSDFIADWARSLGLEVSQDSLSNLIIKKPASAGYESHDPLIIQAHMDMVCEKVGGSHHDFKKDPIELVADGDWLHANGTTLGADNGIGVAMGMAILEASDLKHPPLEVIFTVCEETTFEGAAEVDKSGLKATRMINLDHACEREVIVGSCGGTGVEFKLPITRKAELPNGFESYRISVKGLTGGHSGEDIHRGRGNAILLALRLAEMTGLPIVSIDGGTSRLAISREASVVVLSNDKEKLESALREAEKIFKEEYATESDLKVIMEQAECGLAPLSEDSVTKLKAVLRGYPNGIVRMFDTLPGIVESSDNVGIIRTDESSIEMVSEIRGAYKSTVSDIAETIKSLAAVVGAEVDTFAAYAPWSSKAESPIRDLAIETYKEMYGKSMTPIAVHAGLECGFFADAMPGIDIISVGPDCENFHSPDERVSISSTTRLYDFLTMLISKL